MSGQNKADRSETEPGIAEKVAFLSRPSSYPDQPTHVDRTQSHMAWVFLTDRFAYKLKKPVRYSYLDFRTCAARKRDCHLEVTLNRRLAPYVYLRTVPLVINHQSCLQLDGEGRLIDWLVKMRRLPADRMLDYVIEHNDVTKRDVQKVGDLVGRFYRNAAPVTMSVREFSDHQAAGVELNHRELRAPAAAVLSPQVVDSIIEAQRAFLQYRSDLFEQRIAQGRVIDAHGDLRPEHVFLGHVDLGDRPAVIDCLEFNRKFRLLDMASDFSFLTLECDRLGGGPVSRWFWDTYTSVTGDHPDRQLKAFYRSMHASTRARIAIWHLEEPGEAGPAKWRSKAQQYLELAAAFVRWK